MTWSASTVTSGVTNGLPSRSPPIHEPKVRNGGTGDRSRPGRTRPALPRGRDRFPGSPRRRSSRSRRARPGPRRARSVWWTRSSFELQSSAIVAARRVRARSSSWGRARRSSRLRITEKHARQLVDHGAAAGLGRMGGEHHPDLRPGQQLRASSRHRRRAGRGP